VEETGAGGGGKIQPMSIATGISAVKTGFELVKGVVEILKRPEVDAHEVSARLLELQGLMLEAREALSGAQDEIDGLKKTIKEHDAFKELDADMEFRIDGGFFLRKSEQAKGIIPYCTVCWKSDGKAVPLEQDVQPGTFRCRIHHHTYRTSQFTDYQHRLYTGGVSSDESNWHAK
jgi:hypothetical protein